MNRRCTIISMLAALTSAGIAAPSLASAQMTQPNEEGVGRYLTGLVIDIVKERMASSPLPTRLGDIRTHVTVREGRRITAACGSVSGKRFVSTGDKKTTVIEGDVPKPTFNETWKGLCSGPTTYYRRARR